MVDGSHKNLWLLIKNFKFYIYFCDIYLKKKEMIFNKTDWKKKTRKEIDSFVTKGDYTGGYKFLPWLVYMRPFLILAIFLNASLGLHTLSQYSEIGETSVLFLGSLFSVVIPSIIVFLLIREYKEKKKGKSR